MSTDLLADLRDTADMLTDPRHHREPRYGLVGHHKVVVGHHTTTQPGLLQQLADMAYPGTGTDEADNGGRSVPGSRPPGDIAALSAYLVITMASVRWCHSLRLDLRDTTESNIRQVVATVIGREDHDTQVVLLSELRSWRNQCESITGWSTRAIQLPQPCPHCGERQLRVKTEGPAARCLACGVQWDADTVGVLARVLESYRIDAQARAADARRADRVRQDVRAGKVAPPADVVADGPVVRVEFPDWVSIDRRPNGGRPAGMSASATG
jgi:hypothetical protein